MNRLHKNALLVFFLVLSCGYIQEMSKPLAISIAVLYIFGTTRSGSTDESLEAWGLASTVIGFVILAAGFAYSYSHDNMGGMVNIFAFGIAGASPFYVYLLGGLPELIRPRRRKTEG